MKVLIVGPSPTRSKGGMATVIEEIEKDKILNSQFEIDIFESYIDGNKFKVLLYSIFAFLKFYYPFCRIRFKEVFYENLV